MFLRLIASKNVVMLLSSTLMNFVRTCAHFCFGTPIVSNAFS